MTKRLNGSDVGAMKPSTWSSLSTTERLSEAQGVTPMRQARSEMTFQALIKAGRDALTSGSVDEMTIGDIAKAAGTSVGAFYGRFENKEVFFSVLQQFVVAEIWERVQKLLSDLDTRDAPAVEFLETIAKRWTSIFRENRGLYQATVKHASTRPGAWTPLKHLGWNTSGVIAEKLVSRLPETADDLLVRQAMQFVNGLLVNATINDPGPIGLDDPALDEHLTRFLCLFLGVPRRAQPLRRAGTQRKART